MSAFRPVLVVLACSVVAALASAQSPYRFTFSNPSLGSPQAPALLEYFSLLDCPPCRQFELDELSALLPAVNAGKLRIVFRDLPPADADIPAARHLFCLQETEDFLALRLNAKRTGNYEATPALRDRRKARWDECLEGIAASRIASHNQETFDGYALAGTPAFVLSFQAASHRISWSGRTSSEFIHEAIDNQPDPRAALSARSEATDPRSYQ